MPSQPTSLHRRSLAHKNLLNLCRSRKPEASSQTLNSIRRLTFWDTQGDKKFLSENQISKGIHFCSIRKDTTKMNMRRHELCVCLYAVYKLAVAKIKSNNCNSSFYDIQTYKTRILANGGAVANIKRQVATCGNKKKARQK